MLVSSKGRYALRVIIDLAQQDKDGFVSLKSISERQEISFKYLEIIIADLNKAGLVISRRGKDGGYKLSKPVGRYSVGEVLRVAEGDFASTACLSGDENACSRADDCLTIPMWQNLDLLVNNYLDGIKITDLMNRKAHTEE